MIIILDYSTPDVDKRQLSDRTTETGVHLSRIHPAVPDEVCFHRWRPPESQGSLARVRSHYFPRITAPFNRANQLWFGWHPCRLERLDLAAKSPTPISETLLPPFYDPLHPSSHVWAHLQTRISRVISIAGKTPKTLTCYACRHDQRIWRDLAGGLIACLSGFF